MVKHSHHFTADDTIPMIKKILALFLCYCTIAFAQTTPTPNIGLQLIVPGSEIGSWGPIVNNNWTILDNYFGGVFPTPPMAMVLKSLNVNMTYASHFSGADASCQIAAAEAAVPYPGGIVYAYDLNDVNGTGACNIDAGTKSITILLGPFTYHITQILLRTNTQIIGAAVGTGLDSGSKLPTLIQAMGNDSTPPFVLSQTANEGQESIVLANLNIVGTVGNTSQKGIYILNGGVNAGMWYSLFDNLIITGFGGNDLDFESPVGGGIVQFSTFRRVIALRNSGGAPALQLRGWANSLKFENCEFDGGTAVSGGDGGTNILIDDYSGGIFPPYNIKFDLLTTQWAGIAMQINAGDAISIDQGHFEGDFNAITLGTGAGGSFGPLSITVHDSWFGNGTGVNGGNGSIIDNTASTANASLAIDKSHIYATPDAFMKGNTGSIQVGEGIIVGAEGSYVVVPTQSGAPNGFGNGTASTTVTTTTKGTGTGPTNPQTVVQYQKVTLSNTVYWVPLVQ